VKNTTNVLLGLLLPHRENIV